MTRSILVPIDGSPPSKAGLEHALTTYPDDDITVLHVVAPYERWDSEDPPLPTEVSDAWFETAMEQAEEILSSARVQASDHGVEIQTAIEVGEAWRTIVEYAEENDVDHIIMGSHGRTEDGSIHLGSVAETVVRRAPGLVSVVR